MIRPSLMKWAEVPERDREVFVFIMTKMRDDLARRAIADLGPSTDVGKRSVAMFDAALAELDRAAARTTPVERWGRLSDGARQRVYDMFETELDPDHCGAERCEDCAAYDAATALLHEAAAAAQMGASR